MGLQEAFTTAVFQKYATFQGRATRSEYWWFTLAWVLLMIVSAAFYFGGINAATGETSSLSVAGIALFMIAALGLFIPSLAVLVRRLHDRDMSGWWVLFFAIGGALPLVGILISVAQIVICVLPGTKGDNRFGPDPLTGAANPDVFA